MANHRPLLLGHRGASKYAPENTIAAFDLALHHGCDGFEFDVRYTHDGRSVICHDPRYQRRRIDKSSFSDLNLPAADSVIRNYARRAYLDIELKVAGDASLVLKAVDGASVEGYIVSSFLPDVLKEVHGRNPDTPIALICETERQLMPWPNLEIRAVMLHQKLASSSLVREFHSAGKQVFVWTVNQERDMLRLADIGIDGLISDDTRLLASTFNQK